MLQFNIYLTILYFHCFLFVNNLLYVCSENYFGKVCKELRTIKVANRPSFLLNETQLGRRINFAKRCLWLQTTLVSSTSYRFAQTCAKQLANLDYKGMTKSMPPQFVANKPFLILVRYNQSGSILFLESVSNPTKQ